MQQEAHKNLIQPVSYHCYNTLTASLCNCLMMHNHHSDSPHIDALSWHQRWHTKTSIVTRALLKRDDQPAPMVHLSILPLHLREHRQQLRCQS